MKKALIILTIILTPALLFAQEEQKLNIGFSGYVGYEFYFDTYESVHSRDGQVYLYPKAENLDDQGNDLNKNLSAQMLAIQSRTRITASGLTAFGAKAMAAIEGDFLGTATDYTRLFRLRHAYVQLNWEKAELLTGQTWHPMFVTACFPDVFSFGAAVPFNPLHRAPQIRFTYKPNSNLDFMGAVLFHGDFASSGPSMAQQNSGIPDLQFQFRFHNDLIYAGFTAGYKVLQPRLLTDTLALKTSETIGSYNLQAFAKITTKPLTIKLEGIYGQNLSHLVMLGGYGAAEDPTLVDDYKYENLNTMSVWTELTTNLVRVNFGLFAGYTANLGASGDYYSLKYARGEDISHVYRVSPRIEFSSGKMKFVLEHMMTGAAYATAYDSKHQVTQTADPTINHRILFGAKYVF